MDIRLRIPYRSFVTAKTEKKFEMIANHTIQAVQTLQHRLSKSFKYDELLKDMGVLLPENTVLDTAE